jgi:hypothetical protein
VALSQAAAAQPHSPTDLVKPHAPYLVHTTAGPQRLVAATPADAIRTALELAGPAAQLVRVEREQQW